MEVILLEKIRNLGELGEQVKVKPGFGRNYLIPNRKAVPATPENIAKFEQQRAELERAQADGLAAAEARAAGLKGQSVTVTAKAGTEGKLYGSIGTAEIAEAFTLLGQSVQKREVRLPGGPLRTVGEHSVVLQLHADVAVEVKVVVAAEEVAGR
jgi:large subunit ribosomal protein L9